MIVPAVIGAVGGLIALLLVLLLRGPRETVTIEVDPAPDPSIIHIRVTGEVVRPGIYEIPRGGTVGDAVAAAGGFTTTADTDAITTTALLDDGDQLEVPPRPEAGEATEASPSAGEAVNINTAGLEALEALPGIGPALAQRILDYRAEFGPFQSLDELADVSGISDRMVDELRPLIVIEG